MLKDWLNPIYLDPKNLKKIRKDFLEMKWTKVLFLEDFLLKDKFEKLALEVLNYSTEKEVFSDMYDNYVSSIPEWSFWYKYLEECIESEDFKKILSYLVWNLIDTPWKNYAKINLLKNKESFFHWHTDYEPNNNLKHWTSRLYLHKEWKQEYWGFLELWDIDLSPEEKKKFDDIWSLGISFQSDRFKAYLKKMPKPNTLFYLRIEKTSFHRISDIFTDIPRCTLGQKWYKKK